jgi:hypothetical protein
MLSRQVHSPLRSPISRAIWSA